MPHDDLARTIDDAFEKRNDISPATKGPVRDAVDAALDLLDRGEARVAERDGKGTWRVNQWLKKAVLLSFRLNDMSVIPGGPGEACMVGQGPIEIRRLGRQTLSRGRISRGPGLRGAPFRLCRARRGADAVFRQSRRLCRQRHHG